LLIAALAILSGGGTRAFGAPSSAGVVVDGVSAGDAGVEGSCVLVLAAWPALSPVTYSL